MMVSLRGLLFNNSARTAIDEVFFLATGTWNTNVNRLCKMGNYDDLFRF